MPINQNASDYKYRLDAAAAAQAVGTAAPEVYRFAAGPASAVLLEMPLGSQRSTCAICSTDADWKRLVNGYSGGSLSMRC
jgi:hypothetical protein